MFSNVNHQPQVLSTRCDPHDASSKEKIQPKEDTRFEKKLFRKLTKCVDHQMHEWVSTFANKLAYHSQDTRECGIALADKVLDFPKESKMAQAVCNHIQELLYSTIFLEMAIPKDEFAFKQANALLQKFAFAVEASTKAYPLVRVSEVPERLIVNEVFIADPRIMLYNIFLKSAGTQLSEEDNTLEIQVAVICAQLRNQLFQECLPLDVKNRPVQECYVKGKIQEKLCLVETSYENTVDEKDVDRSYKRMQVRGYMEFIVDGCSIDKYDYTATDGRNCRYTIPIPKGQGYANPQLLIDHLVKHASFDLSRIRDRMETHFGAEASERIKEYISPDTGEITQAGARALLYSLGYLIAKLEKHPQFPAYV